MMELLTNKRLFLIEDNIEHRIITRLLLMQHGARLEFDMWGRDTTQRLKAFMPVDAILLDLMLPGGISGYKVFEQIRAEPMFAKVPVVAVSAADSIVAIHACQKSGFSGFIAKPIDVNLFPQQIAGIIRGEQVWHSGLAYVDLPKAQ